MKFKNIIRYFFTFIFLSFAVLGANTYSVTDILDKYNELNLEEKIPFSAFENALNAAKQVPTKINNILTIVDFTKPSTEKRMFVIDLEKNKVLISTLVSHGKGTGDLYAQNFSNKNNSYKSSSGFFLTGNIYKGRNGESLELFGLEKGINNNVRMRNIVIHGANYASQSFIDKYGRLGRSKGCFAVPPSVNKILINTIVGGSLFYVHTKNYENKEFHLN